MTDRQQAFVAYAAGDQSLASTILGGVQRANALPLAVRYEPWLFNDIAGVPIISPILERIDESVFLVADITYLNLNVVYEIGFAIGRGKRTFLVRHSETEGDKILARDAGIFDTLGYQEYSGEDGLKQRLSAHIDANPLPFSLALDHRAPVYMVEPPTRTTAATMVTSRLKKATYRYRSFNPSEDVRLSATDAIRGVAASAGVVLILQAPDVEGAKVHNIRALFAVGLAHGMGKPTLILSPAGFDAPMDVRDFVRPYRFPDDIGAHIADFCPLINDCLQQADPLPIEAGGLLQSLSIGDPTAENEMTTLGRYYLRTDQYQRAMRGEVNLVVGRKGAGKTALFIQLRDRVRSDKRNIVVDLKPEGYQLIKLKEDILSYLSDGAQQHLITAFWEYLILLEVAYKLLEKDQHIYRHNHEIHDLYVRLERLYRTKDFASEGDFSERLLTLSEKVSSKYRDMFGSAAGTRLTSKEITEVLYTHDIRELRDLISDYLEKKESVWILFDNLDKGWSTQGVDALDAIVLRCLVDASHKIEREMQKAGHPFHCIAFVRNDVYDHLMSNSADYGKEMRATLDWTDPDLLKEMLRLRLISGLTKENGKISFEQLWPNVCLSHYKGEETSSYFIERSLMRPRNLLKIFNHCRGFATNFNRQRISDDDIEKGLRAYSLDLLTELDHELSDVFPGARDLLYYFIDSAPCLSTERLKSIICESGVNSQDVGKVIDFLLYYGVIGLRINGEDTYIFSVNYDLRMLKIRMERAKDGAEYVISPAFWSALNVKEQPALHLEAIAQA